MKYYTIKKFNFFKIKSSFPFTKSYAILMFSNNLNFIDKIFLYYRGYKKYNKNKNFYVKYI